MSGHSNRVTQSNAPPPSLDGLSTDRIALNVSFHRAAELGNLETCQTLLSSDPTPDTWYEDPNRQGWSALHFAALSGNDKLVKLLLRHGAVWNAVDGFGTTAAQVAYSLNYDKCYRAILEEGVRQTILVNLLDRKQEEDEVEQDEPETKKTKREKDTAETDGNAITLHPVANEVTNSNTDFLKSKLRFIKDKTGKMRCLDQDDNMVMADWETDIMELSAKLICQDQKPDFSVLNVGFGLGIVDTLIQGYHPGRHVIIEAHPDTLDYMRQLGWYDRPGVEIFEGRWEDWISDSSDPSAIAKFEKLGTFDAVYWDTYSQDYNDIRKLFECLPTLLTGPEAKFSFFHGLAATNPFFYDVYTRVAELDLKEIGLTTEWYDMVPQVTEEEWEGVRRKYWTLDVYHCPLSRLDF